MCDVTRGVHKLIRIKTIKPGKWSTIIIVLLGILVVFIGIRNVYSNQGAKGVSSQGNIEKTDDSRRLVSNLLKTVLDRAFPILKTGVEEEASDPIFKSLLRVVARWNYRDPRHLIAAELPIMESYNLAMPNRGRIAELRYSEPHDPQGELEDILSQFKPGEIPLGTDAEGGQQRTGDRFQTPAKTTLDMGEPVVLIYHTHTSEAYKPSKLYNYTPTDVDRTIDPRYTVVRVGKELKKELEGEYGIRVEHITTFHDYPEYTPAYSRSLKSAQNIMAKYPSIKVIIDVHRDAFRMSNNTEKQNARAVSVINISGQDVARILLVWGPDTPNSGETRKFAELLKNKINGQYPGLCRGVLEKKTGQYNQQLSNYAVLVEIGSNSSTMEEALEAVPYFARALSEAIKEIKE